MRRVVLSSLSWPLDGQLCLWHEGEWDGLVSGSSANDNVKEYRSFQGKRQGKGSLWIPRCSWKETWEMWVCWLTLLTATIMVVVIIMMLMTAVTSDVTEDGWRCAFPFYSQFAVSQVYRYSVVTVAAGSSMDVTEWRSWPDGALLQEWNKTHVLQF